MATSMRRLYPGFPTAAKINEGFVVASYKCDIAISLFLRRRGGKCYLGLVNIDSCIREVSSAEISVNSVYLHSKSPESETTTVPVALSWSREVDIVSMVAVETKKSGLFMVKLGIKIYPDYRACTGYDVRLISAVQRAIPKQYITQFYL